MKNIHILPTDKPSRLYIGDNQNFVFGFTQTSIQSRNDCFTNQHIYITSDEEIKEGNWVLNISNDKIFKQDNSKPDTYTLSFWRKIILTTDQDLIKDGVQSIDDDFLEWFVKNPSCEEIEVEHAPDGVFYYKDKDDIPYGCYKILIPKEEPKHLGQITEKGIIDIIGNCANCGVEFHIHKDIPKSTQQIIDEDFNGGLTMGQIIPKEEPKQESYICPHTKSQCYDECCVSAEDCHIKAQISILSNAPIDEIGAIAAGLCEHLEAKEQSMFIAGFQECAKWMQQEQRYNEEDVKNAFLDGWQLRDGDLPFPKAKKEWFEQFKNK